MSPLGVDVKVAGASAGLLHTLLQASVSVAKANTEASVGWEYTGALAGASLAEARALPFGVRVGVKFGAGIRNGIPEADVGLGTVPCCVMYYSAHTFRKNIYIYISLVACNTF